MNTHCRLVVHYNPPLTYHGCQVVICPTTQMLMFATVGFTKTVMIEQFFTAPLAIPDDERPVVSLVLNPNHPNAVQGEFLLEMHFDEYPILAAVATYLINDIGLGTFQNRMYEIYKGQLHQYNPENVYPLLERGLMNMADHARARNVPVFVADPVQREAGWQPTDQDVYHLYAQFLEQAFGFLGSPDQQPTVQAAEEHVGEEGWDDSEEVEDENVAEDVEEDQEDPEGQEEPEDQEQQEQVHAEHNYAAPATPEPVIRNHRRDGGSPPALDREPDLNVVDDSSSVEEPVAQRPRQGERQRGRRGGRRRQRRGQQQQEQQRRRDRVRSSSESSASTDSGSRDRHGNHIRRSVIEHCRVRNSTITDSVLLNCEVRNSTVRNSQIAGCSIRHSDCNHVRLNH